MENLDEYLNHLIGFMKETSKLRPATAMAFIVPCCYIEYLTKLYNNGSNNKSYKKFIKDVLSEVNPKYKSFIYKSGDKDLDIQMYHILRCGIVHSFSLYGDKKKDGDGRKQSIVLGHKNYDEGEHLSSFSNEQIEDACLFILEDFIEDLEKATHKLLEIANQKPEIKNNIENWLKEHPFISGL